MVLPHHIEEAERIGMPRDKIGLVLQFCRQCDKKLTDNPDKCDECGRETCPKCWYYIPDIGLKFCGKECAITKLLKLLAAAEMNDKPITEHPDVQRLIIQVETLSQENKKLKKFVQRVSDTYATGGDPEYECELCRGELQYSAKQVLKGE